MLNSRNAIEAILHAVDNHRLKIADHRSYSADVAAVVLVAAHHLNMHDVETFAPVAVLQAADAVHLLGVAQNRLVASGECLYWFDMTTGQLVGQFPSAFHASAGHARPARG